LYPWASNFQENLHPSEENIKHLTGNFFARLTYKKVGSAMGEYKKIFVFFALI
jgi:hypothetical protein